MEAFVESYWAALGSLGGDRRDCGDPPNRKDAADGAGAAKISRKIVAGQQ